MSGALAILGWILFGGLIVAGLLLDMVGLFGNWVILGAIAIAWIATGFTHFGPWAIGGIAALAVLGEILEMGAAGYGAAKFGASRGAIIAALAGCLVGSIVGTPWFPVVGTLAGACLGAFLGATAYEYVLIRKEAPQAFLAGFGAALGKVVGIFAKAVAGIAMLGVALLAF